MSPESTALCSHYNSIPKIQTTKNEQCSQFPYFPFSSKIYFFIFLLYLRFPLCFFFRVCFVFDNSARQLSHSIINLTFNMLYTPTIDFLHEAQKLPCLFNKPVTHPIVHICMYKFSARHCTLCMLT